MESENVPRPRFLRRSRAVVLVLSIVAFIAYRATTFLNQPQQRRGRFQDAGNQPLGVARIRRADIHRSLHALGAVTLITQQNRLAATVSLVAALGGGWDTSQL